MDTTAPSTTITPFPDPPVAHLKAPVTSAAQPVPVNPAAIDALIAASLAPPPQSPPPQQPQGGSFNKEVVPPPQPAETTHLVEIQETEKIPEEVEGWLQKLNDAGEIKLPEPITHDGDVLLAGTEAQVVKEKLVLPMSQTSMNTGLKAKVTESARWLAEWCMRLVKLMNGNVKYSPEPVTTPMEEKHGQS